MSKGILVFLLAISVFGGVRPANAEPANCLTDFMRCMLGAAQQDGFWWRAAAGIDCELNFWKCFREALLF